MRSRSFFAGVVLLAVPALLLVLPACGGNASHATPPDGGEIDARPAPAPERTDPGAATDPGDTSAPEHWCLEQGAHSFCADFDVGDPLAAMDLWTTDDPTTLTPATDAAPTSSDRSAPRAMELTVHPAPAEDGGSPNEADIYLEHELAATAPTSLHVAFDVKIASFGVDDDTDAMTPLLVSLDRHHPDGSITYGVAAAVVLQKTSAAIQLYGDPTDADASAVGPETSQPLESLPIGSWVRVEADLSLAGGVGSLTVSYDGRAVGHATLAGLDTSAMDRATLDVGAILTPPAHSGSIVVDVDDVVADVH